MKEGTKVKVVANVGGHEFKIGEIVARCWGEYECSQSMGFYSEQAGLWYMKPDEYEIVDKNYAISLMADAMNMARNQGFSRAVWEVIADAIEQAEEELENEHL